MQLRPYTLIGAGVLDGVRRLLDGAVGHWCADWGVARDALTLGCQRAWEGEPHWPAAWRQAWTAGEGGLTLAWSEELGRQVQHLLFAPDTRQAGAPRPAPLAAEAAGAAWQDLLARLAAVAVPGARRDDQPGAPPDGAWRHGSGALLLTLRVGRHCCHGLLDAAAVQALAPQAAGPGQPGQAGHQALAPLAACDYQQLLAAVPVRLPVEIGRVELGLGSVVSLRVGDVIRLNTPADRALRVAGPSGRTLFGGYLGLKHDSVALEVVRHD